jgi:hypothetical protein
MAMSIRRRNRPSFGVSLYDVAVDDAVIRAHVLSVDRASYRHFPRRASARPSRTQRHPLRQERASDR